MEMQLDVALKKEKDNYNPNLMQSLKYLKRVKVLLPEWVKAIPLILPRKDIIRWRREFPRFLDIIKCSCALYQYQREKDDEGYYSISAFVGVALTIAIHYLFISTITLHPTIHVAISILFFFLISGALSALLVKFWNKF